MQNIKKVFLTYKLFTIVVVIMTCLLLIRIPLGTFNIAAPIDVVGHFILPAFGAPLLAMILQEIRLIPRLEISPLIFLIFLLGITLEVFWEIFEFCIDGLFHLSWQPNNADTMTDIILGVCGAIVGALIFTKMYKNTSSSK